MQLYVIFGGVFGKKIKLSRSVTSIFFKNVIIIFLREIVYLELFLKYFSLRLRINLFTLHVFIVYI